MSNHFRTVVPVNGERVLSLFALYSVHLSGLHVLMKGKPVPTV